MRQFTILSALFVTATAFGQQQTNHAFTLSVTVNGNIQGPVCLGYFDEKGKNTRDSKLI